VKGEKSPAGKIQFSLIYSEGKYWTGREIVVRTLSNGLDTSRFGFVVSRRLGNAVTRNKIKRRLREIARKIPVKPGWDIIIIARIPALNTTFWDLSKSVRQLLDRAGILAEENESSSSQTD
jgi:ribonuclease P protein component